VLRSSVRAIIKGHNPYHLLRLNMLDFPLMLPVKLPVVERILPRSNKFAMGVENTGTGDSKLNDSTDCVRLNFNISRLAYC